MAKKGDQAREAVKNTIIDAFSAIGGFVAFQDKKIYVQAKDGSNNEMIQIAITMTIPKTPIEAGGTPAAADSNGAAWEQPTPVSTELNPTDKQEVERLKQMLKDKGVYKE